MLYATGLQNFLNRNSIPLYKFTIRALTTTEKTLQLLRNLFASYGLPDQIVTDNRSQFTSSEFQRFTKANGIKHIRSAPYHAATNGEAERCVQTFKKSLRAAKSDPGNLQFKLAQFLLSYRSTPHSTAGLSPAELFLKRPIKTRLDLLHPSVERKVLQSQASQKMHHDAYSKDRSFEIGETVWVANLRGEPKWLCGVIIEQSGPISYRVSVSDDIWRRHIDHLRSGGMASTETSSSANDCIDECPYHESSSHSSTETVPNTPESSTSTDQERRYPERNRRPTQRLIENT